MRAEEVIGYVLEGKLGVEDAATAFLDEAKYTSQEVMDRIHKKAGRASDKGSRLVKKYLATKSPSEKDASRHKHGLGLLKAADKMMGKRDQLIQRKLASQPKPVPFSRLQK